MAWDRERWDGEGEPSEIFWRAFWLFCYQMGNTWVSLLLTWFVRVILFCSFSLESPQRLLMKIMKSNSFQRKPVFYPSLDFFSLLYKCSFVYIPSFRKLLPLSTILLRNLHKTNPPKNQHWWIIVFLLKCFQLFHTFMLQGVNETLCFGNVSSRYTPLSLNTPPPN